MPCRVHFTGNWRYLQKVIEKINRLVIIVVALQFENKCKNFGVFVRQEETLPEVSISGVGAHHQAGYGVLV